MSLSGHGGAGGGLGLRPAAHASVWVPFLLAEFLGNVQ